MAQEFGAVDQARSLTNWAETTADIFRDNEQTGFGIQRSKRWDMTRDDALRTLGLKDGCTAAEIRKAYKEQSFAWHPDRFEAGSSMQNRAAEMMKEINEAYAVDANRT